MPPLRPTPATARRLAWILGLMSAFPPLAVDMYLPAFPQIARELGTTIGTVQITLAIFLLGLAVGQILWGILSDHLGRRMPLLCGCLLFGCMAAVCAVAGSIEALIAARFLMGLGGSAGLVKRILRHSTEAIGQTWYVHPDLPGLKEAFKNVEY